MFDDMDPCEACEFADDLRQAADRLEHTHAGDDPKPRGAGHGPFLSVNDGDFEPARYSTLEEALVEIRKAARWYQTIGDLGFGVHAWY